MITIKKILSLLLVLIILVSCSQGKNNKEPEKQETAQDNEKPELNVGMVNEWLNGSVDLGPGTKANQVAIVPIDHIDGPREENTFYSFVNFKYKARNFIKYQISYLSCTCRSADVNFWQTAYVELSLPESGKIEDAVIKTLSFDQDSSNHYLGGFWGDSNPTPAGHSYEMFKEQYIPFYEGKTLGYVYGLSVVEDIDPKDYASGDGRENLKVDAFSGSSVSTNNIIRMLQALGKYHATDDFFSDDPKAQELAMEMNGASGSMPAKPAGEAQENGSNQNKELVALPAPVNLEKEYKANKDSDKLTKCEEGNFSPDCSSINSENLLDFLNRPDTVYIDLRDYKDTQSKHFRNFEQIPFFGLIYAKEPTADSVQLFSGDTKAPVAHYEESVQLIEELFPRDKNIFLVCQSGGRVGMMMDILKALGYDMSRVYNIGGMAHYVDAKYNEMLVDTLELKVENAYSVEGLTKLAEPKAVEAKDVKKIEIKSFVDKKADALPLPVDTSKEYKKDKDAKEMSKCEKGVYSPDCSSINKDNLLEYLGRDDTVYIDLRDYTDYLSKHFRNFEPIPFFGLIYAKEPTPDSVQLFSGDTKNPTANYAESKELLEVLFPKDKYIMLVCQSGGRVGMLMNILEANGYDMTKIYNVGGVANYTDSKYEDLVVDANELKSKDTYQVEGLTKNEPVVLNLTDGEHEGVAQGRNGDIKVKVVVSNQKISKIEVLEQKETPDFYEGVEELILPQIIEKNSVEGIDLQAGATASSKGIIQAVANALK